MWVHYHPNFADDVHDAQRVKSAMRVTHERSEVELRGLYSTMTLGCLPEGQLTETERRCTTLFLECVDASSRGTCLLHVVPISKPGWEARGQLAIWADVSHFKFTVIARSKQHKVTKTPTV